MAPLTRLHFAIAQARALRAIILLLASISVLLTACDQRQDLADRFSVFPLPGGHGRTGSITSGPDGNLWFTYFDKGQIARMTPKGALTIYQLPNQYAGPYALIAGPDGAVWFTESYDRKIGRITMMARSRSSPGFQIASQRLPSDRTAICGSASIRETWSERSLSLARLPSILFQLSPNQEALRLDQMAISG